MYVNSRISNIKELHLIYGNSELIILDENKNIVPMCEEIYNAKFLGNNGTLLIKVCHYSPSPLADYFISFTYIAIFTNEYSIFKN